MIKLLKWIQPFCLGVLFTAVAHAAPPEFAQLTSDLKVDPAAHFGTLPNGLHYVIRHNAEPKGRASLRLVVAAGSFMESENQRGLAHFLEHMAFNGTEHYAANTLVTFFQRMGMNFGGDTNAFTSFDRTAYFLELPDTKGPTLTEGFQVLADYAGGMLLEPKEIDDERGIILSEKRTRDSVGYRTMLAEMDFTLNGTRVPARIPIGLENIIQHGQRPEFTDFYNTWYRPELTAIVAVGDFDVAEVERQIVATFTPLAPRGPARPAPALGQLPLGDGLHVRFHPEPEAGATTVSISILSPYQHETDTAAKRLAELPRSLPVMMLNRRLSILAKQEGAPFTAASAGVGEEYDFYREASIQASCQPAQWSAALGVIEQELRRALDHGFQNAELHEATANFKQGLDQAVLSAPTRRSPEIADEIFGALIDRVVVTTAQTDQELFAPALAKVTPEECAAALRAAWQGSGRNVFVTGNATIAGDAIAALTTAYNDSRSAAVVAPVERIQARFAYTDFGQPGIITQRSTVADLGITQVEFANGVRVNLKATDFEANRIHLGLRVGTGKLTEPREQPGLGVFAQAMFLAGGLGKHSADDLRQILAGRTVGMAFGIGNDAVQLNGATNKEDLLLQCQLLAAELTDPGYRAEALRQVKKSIEQFYTGLDHSIDGPFSVEVPRLLAGGDSRFGLPPRNVLDARTVDEVKAWLTPQLKRGPIEVAIAGDLEVEATLKIVAATLGALPAREPRPALTPERQVSFPANSLNKEFRIETKIPKGSVALFWPATDANDAPLARRLNLLAEILSDRMRVKVREEIGGAYSPSADASLSDTFTGYGYVVARLTVEPAQATKIADVVQAIATDLCEHGVTDEELNRAKQPLLTKLHESVRTNGYWLGSVLSRAQEKPVVLEWCRNRTADTEAVTKTELDALAKQYLGAARLCRFISLPASGSEPVAVLPLRPANGTHGDESGPPKILTPPTAG